MMQRMKTLHRSKGIAHDLIVTKEGNTVTLWTAAGVRQTVLDLGAPHLPGLEYARNTLVVLAFTPRAASFLILGLGGGSIPRMLLAARPGAAVDAVEVDPAIPDLARRFFQVAALPRFRVHLEDAAAFMDHCNTRYDVIVVDAYIGEKYPDQCATAEFLTRARDCLTGEGVVVVNWMGGNHAVHQRLLTNIHIVIGDAWQLHGARSRNTLLFAPVRATTRPELLECASRIEREIPFANFLARLAKRLTPLSRT
jgi:spermidine synthase